ncbi:putative UDP-N-acetylmuramoyl-L-alanine--D-glutamate ligase [Rosa chinensis]|uniref:Putative UDP-N-acetylmuramoyl-L-alanine--D-glutamate ligase n=1 Tax=Rosa chinensis TaxID=74649 RepID=A0A2P6RDR8_ROSCH|nr:putative UDP-N-acetylmuramoyl-L-alanine--D-glutamate ligase [Rosa chinensis]
MIGLGKSGRAAARLALARGAASVLAFDHNPTLGLLEKDPVFEVHGGDNGASRTILGQFDGELLNNVDRVVVSPGVPLRKYGLSSLLQSGKQVMSELDFAAEILPKCIKILAVTGTNGKSTVVTFAGQYEVSSIVTDGNLFNSSEARCLIIWVSTHFWGVILEIHSQRLLSIAYRTPF